MNEWTRRRGFSPIRELIILRASQIIVSKAKKEIPASPSPSSPFALTAAITGKMTDNTLQEDIREAETWVHQAISLIRKSSDADPGWTDEQIAHLLLERFRSRNPSDPRVGLGIAKEKKQGGPPG